MKNSVRQLNFISNFRSLAKNNYAISEDFVNDPKGIMKIIENKKKLEEALAASTSKKNAQKNLRK